MSLQDNKAKLTRLIEHDWVAATSGKPEVLNEYFAAGFVNHSGHHHDRQAKDTEALKAEAAHVGASASDLSLKVDLLVGEGDILAAHWSSSSRRTGGRPYKHVGHVDSHDQVMELSGVFIGRFQDGKIVEAWNYDNHLDTMVEHGVLVTKK